MQQMPRKTIDLVELEPEDLELLARLAKETGKSVNQLILESVRATYGVSCSRERERDTTAAVVKAIGVLNVQIEMMRAVVELQGKQIRSLSGTVTGSATGKRINSALHERGVDTERQHAGRGNHKRHTRSQETT
ncbi:MAG: hypothetical protein CLLPBCKN_002217 [Chroococcidiopsis cubana SAG 39.79]|uniref:Ribbon-helix-helix protein CopG domain-containing protein n=1 Tax=Chroococcidiopsis cubana SAG 39.79 TaxID=388085 RepID=A0AB37UN95_9CYAN|nr:ribbon-helix-helix protein, CopG family [Chroococcidiopsis cubana]MDZ4872821.1 hypothetical protein [Chroococcidiopsis cubana SAG 39.79]PSB66041.1 hypothetical protein C7B79_02720 [Chroococcidiopsis cubana CCALA 043]RUT12855.1 hypothetical protein DSM107010_19850 [Chroococcidiopsis cubana SAG 39.79]